MTNQNRNLLVAVTLWLALMFGLNLLFPNLMGVKHPPVTQKGQPAAAQQPAPSAAAPASGGTAAAPKAADVPRGTAEPRPPPKTVVFETPRARVVATSEGAAVKNILLLGDKWTRHKGAKEESQVDLVPVHEGEPLPFSTVVRGADGAALIPADAAYAVVEQDATHATFRAEQGGVTVTKTLSLNPQTYGIALSVEVAAAEEVKGTLAVLSGGHAEQPAGGLFASRTNTPARTICVHGNDKVERLAIGAKTPVFEAPAAEFAGIDEQYFLTAVMPPEGVAASCRLEAHGEKVGSLISSLVVPLSVGKGAAVTLSFKGYAGPKDDAELAAVAAPLKHSIDWGFWSVIAEVLLGVMKFFQRIVPGHNWGVSIILLTLAMKVVTFPLQHKSMKSMQEMQRIQPQLDALKKKYAGDTQRQNLEQMKLFKEHGVNPMGSCLPMLIQMPIWFALYTTLQVSVELYNAPFIHGWLDDLTAADPFYVLPVAMGITMILTQVLTPTPMSNKSQKTMGYVMSGFFSLLMLTLPSGLTLYIFTNNVLSIGQQMYLRRQLHTHPPKASGQTIEVENKKDDRSGGSGGDADRAKLRA
ncbi:MAG TPA: membrane protein insertase YidC [Myxococcales bacterium]|nr:membrane protein insertase YidC [Myxococcales bacterium]